MIMSTDALEHVPPGLVAQVVAEIGRVAAPKASIFLQISTRPEMEIVQYGSAGKQDMPIGSLPKGATDKPLTHGSHETIKWPSWWISQFSSSGWTRCSKPHTLHGRRCSAYPGLRFGVLCDAKGFSIEDFWFHCSRD